MVATVRPASLPEMSAIPKKLRDDAIAEAVCQFQFKTSGLPEVVIGRLSLEPKWKEFIHKRLPFADIPAPVRNADPSLKMQPTYELRSSDESRIVRLGENLLSYHLIGVGKYCGWTLFREELEGAARAIFERLDKPEITRISLRYINAIHPERHFINSLLGLELEVRAGDGKVSDSLNLNYVEGIGKEYVTTTRIAHPSFVVGKLPERTVAVIDVEVTTGAQFSATDSNHVTAWIEHAHTLEKQAFFRLIPQEVVSRLRED